MKTSICCGCGIKTEFGNFICTQCKAWLKVREYVAEIKKLLKGLSDA